MTVADNKRVQVHLLAGDVENNAGKAYEYSGYTLFPRSVWGSSYWSPVSTNPGGSAPTQITVYNPADQGSDIYVRCQYRSTSLNQTIAAGQSAAYEVPNPSGANCYAVSGSGSNTTPSGKQFFAISTTDAANFGSTYGGKGWDWGIR